MSRPEFRHTRRLMRGIFIAFMPAPRTAAAQCERDPIKYANRPEDRAFDPMKVVRDMLARLIAGGKA